jgi:hypothetical protein
MQAQLAWLEKAFIVAAATFECPTEDNRSNCILARRLTHWLQDTRGNQPLHAFYALTIRTLADDHISHSLSTGS